MKRTLIWTLPMLIPGGIFFFNRELSVLVFPILIVVLSFITERDQIWAWIPAVLVSWVWVFTARGLYINYNVFTYSIFGISFFPIVAWPSMLTGMHMLIFVHVKGKNRWIRWLKFSLIYSGCIITAEYIGYNYAGVRLASGTGYPGWPVLNIFHCPVWMQIGYFLNGIVFGGIIAYLIDRDRGWFLKALALKGR